MKDTNDTLEIHEDGYWYHTGWTIDSLKEENPKLVLIKIRKFSSVRGGIYNGYYDYYLADIDCKKDFVLYRRKKRKK